MTSGNVIDDGILSNYRSRIIQRYLLLLKSNKEKEEEEEEDSESDSDSDTNEKTKTLNLYKKAMEWLSNRECHTVEPDLLVPKDLYSSLFPFQKLSLEWFYNVHRTNVGK